MSADPASVKDLVRFAEPWDADSWDVKPGPARSLEPYRTDDAVDPSVADSGMLTTREKES